MIQNVLESLDLSRTQSFNLHKAGRGDDGKTYLFDTGDFLLSKKEASDIAQRCMEYLMVISDDEIEQYNRVILKSREYNDSHKVIETGQKETFIYLMHNTRSNHYKIGRSALPEFREKTLQAQEPEIELVCSFPGTTATEKLLHEKYKDKRSRGEWFLLTEEDVKYIKSLIPE